MKSITGTKVISLIVIIIVLAIAGYVIYSFYEALTLSAKLGKSPFEVWSIAKAFLSAQAILFGIGAVIWIWGTAIFILEVFLRRTFVGFKLVKYELRLGPIEIAVAAMCAAIYAASLLATAAVVFVPGFTWLRPGNALAPIFGMLFGIPGAIGCAFGNLIADIFGGYFGVGSFGGFIGNFLIAYIPYKFIRDQTFRTSRSLGEFYLWGSFAQAIVSALYICWWLDVAKELVGLPPLVIWGVICPIIFSNNITVTAILSPIIGYALYPLVRSWGLHWSQRMKIPGVTT